MTLNNIYLLLFLISFSLFVFYALSLLKAKNITSLKNKKNNRTKINFLLFIVAFILISIVFNIIYALIVTIVGAYFSWIISENKKQKYKKEIDKQILEIIRLFRNVVSSGENIVQSIESVSQQIKEPLSSEFKEISDKVKLGVSLDEALKDSADRIQNEQYGFFMDSVRISYRTGIKISDILSKIEDTVAQKISLANKVDVLTSQVRFSGMIISIIPFFIVFLVYFVEPEMVSFLFSSILGNMILFICVIMIISGSFIMKRIADIKL
jgi:tight adherence protein B